MKKVIFICLSILILVTGCSTKDNSNMISKNENKQIEVKKENEVNSEESTNQESTSSEKEKMESNSKGTNDGKDNSSTLEEKSEDENLSEENNMDNMNEESSEVENKEDDENASKDDMEEIDTNIKVEEGQLVTVYDIFPKEVGVNWGYIGAIDYETKERLVDIQESKELNEIKYYIEGFDYSDMSGSIKDNSYCKIYSVRDNNLYCEISTLKSPLLKGDKLIKDGSWEGDYFTDDYGPIKALFKVQEIDEYKVVVKIIPKSYEEECILQGYSETITFGRGKGITDKRIVFPFVDSQDAYNFSITLNTISRENGEDNFNLYYNVSDELKGFYNIEESYYRLIKGQIISNLRKGLWEEENLKNHYKEEIAKLPKNEIRAVSEVYNIANIFYQATKDSFYVFDGIKEYEDRVKNLNTYLVEEKLKISEENWDHYFYPNKQFMREMKATIRTDLNSLEEIKISILKNNYLHLNYSSINRLDESLDLLENTQFLNLPENILYYVKFKEMLYMDSSDNYDIEDKEKFKILLDGIVYYEKIVENGSSQYKEILEELVSYYLPKNPQAIFSDNGRIHKKNLESYKEYLDINKDGKYYSIINEIVKLVEANSGYYSKKLKEYLIQENFNSEACESILENLESIKESEEYKLFSGVKVNYKELEEIQGEEIIEVSNAKEFLDGLGDNRIIKVVEDISLYTEYSPKDERIQIWDGSLKISGVKNLTIIGVGEIPVKISAATTWEVLGIEESENITFRNVSLGHINDYCRGPVISAQNVKNLKVEDSIIYGCGVIGLKYNKVSDIEVTNTLIWDCSSDGIAFDDVSGGSFQNTIITKNGRNAIQMDLCSDIEFNEVQVFDNNKEGRSNKSVDGINITNSERISFKCCLIEGLVKDIKVNE